MSKKIKQILAIVLCIAIGFSNMTFIANATSSMTTTSTSPSSNVDILHMDRTVTTTSSDGTSKNGFDVTVTAYLDELSKVTTPIDVMFVCDASNSMDVSARNAVVDSITRIITTLKGENSSINHRFGLVSFSNGLMVLGTLNRLYSASETDVDSGDWKSALDWYQAYTFANNIGTYTYKGLEKANSILDKYRVPGRQQMVILFSDGMPTGLGTDFSWFDVTNMFYTDTAGKETLKQSNALKSDGVLIYSVATYYSWPATDSDKKIAKNILKYVSSAYGTNTTNPEGSYTATWDEDQYVHTANNIDALIKALVNSIYTTAIYPFVLNERAITQDVVSPYFTPSNAKCVIQKANYNNGIITSWTNASDYKSITAQIDGQRVYATGFDFINRAVSNENTNPARLVITYHIDPIPNFFGGNNIPTNKVGSRSNDNPLTGGSGIYCEGPDNDFLKPFENIPVNVLIKSRAVATNSATVSYGTIVDIDNYFAIPDLESNGYLNGVNNKYVDVLYTITYNRRSDGKSGTNKTIKNVTAGTDYAEKAINWFAEHKVITTEGDTFTIGYTVTPKGNGQNAVGAINHTKTGFSTEGVIKTTLSYAVTFQFVGSYLDEIPYTAPASQSGLTTQAQVTNIVNNTSLTAGDIYETDSAKYYFSGWILSNENPKPVNGVITYRYMGQWSKEIVKTDYTINIYRMDEYGNYPSEPETISVENASVGDSLSIFKRPIYDENVYKFFTGNDLYSQDSYENYGYGDSNARYPQDRDINCRQKFFTYEVGNASIPVATASCYLCPECGSVFDELYMDDDLSYCSGCASNINTSELLLFEDYTINYQKSDKNIICVANAEQNIFNVYVDRVPHTMSFTVNYNDKESENFQFTALYGASITDTLYYGSPVTTNTVEDYYNFAYDEYGWLVEESLYYDGSLLKTGERGSKSFSFPYFTLQNNTLVFVNKDSFYENSKMDYLIELFENSFVFGNIMPAYDVNSSITLDRLTYDLTITKQYKIGQRQIQNCIFALYEQNALGEYSLLTKFVIGADEFEYNSKTKAFEANKTICGLTAGNTYVVEEEKWSYKTVSTWKRGSSGEHVILNETNKTVEKTCVNSQTNSSQNIMAVEKGVRNEVALVNNSPVVSASTIIRKPKEGQK